MVQNILLTLINDKINLKKKTAQEYKKNDLSSIN